MTVVAALGLAATAVRPSAAAETQQGQVHAPQATEPVTLEDATAVLESYLKQMGKPVPPAPAPAWPNLRIAIPGRVKPPIVPPSLPLPTPSPVPPPGPRPFRPTPPDLQLYADALEEFKLEADGQSAKKILTDDQYKAALAEYGRRLSMLKSVSQLVAPGRDR